jgi:hypothetical protein
LEKQQPVLEYLIPLVDANMVRDPMWHDYLTELAEGCEKSERRAPSEFRGALYPVALDATAFNLPRIVARRNFIRHGTVEKDAGEGAEAEETLKHLTEALARDLDGRVFEKKPEVRGRLKIFISYARADGANVAKALRNYIQGETQCQAFLDENDIGYGQPFDECLSQNVDEIARAMLVVNSDHYADRSWCRWEIERFTSEDILDRQPLRSGVKARRIYFYHPLLVVDAVNGNRMTRVIPELAQAPVVRWDEKRARLCFSTLMREVLLGLRDVRVAEQVFREEEDSANSVFVNRLPGPVAIERLLRRAFQGSGHASPRSTIRYPGNGMSLIELRLLRRTFEAVRFRAFRDVLPESKEDTKRQAGALRKMRDTLERIEAKGGVNLPLQGKVLAISSAHCKDDLAAIGTLPQHQDEALIHLLRPLLRLGADLSYGGVSPKETADASAKPSATRNITAALLRLVSEERPEDSEAGSSPGSSPKVKSRGSLLFNVCAWPRYEKISAADEAAWINSYRILRFDPTQARLRAWTQRVPSADETPPPGYLRVVALTTNAVRAGVSKGFNCRLPGAGEYAVKPSAFIFIGGKTSEFSGIMPGIMEEFVYAARTKRPMYLLGGLGGAAGVIARALGDNATAPRPPELTVKYYLKQKSWSKLSNFPALFAELKPKDPRPEPLFDELWALIRKHRKTSLDELFRNGLSHEENQALIATEDTLKAIRLTWAGISDRFL